MATITFKGAPVTTRGTLPAPGQHAPDFRLTTSSLEDVSLKRFAGKRKVLSINPSFETRVCQVTARNFNSRVGERPNTVLLAISADLPFAQKRFCEGEGLTHVTPLSMMRDRKFGEDYGVLMTDGPLEGLTARAVLVLDEHDRVLHSELVPEVAEEPNYEQALVALAR